MLGTMLLVLAGGGACSSERDPSFAESIRLDTDSIGPVPTATPLGELRARWTAARDTLYQEHEAIFPALLIPLGATHAMAVQARMDQERGEPGALDEECPADFWVVHGSDAWLPGGVSLGTTWDTLVQVHGPARVSTEVHTARVSLERLPAWLFDLDLTVDEIERIRDEELEGIPAEARIWRAFLHVPVANPGRCAPPP